MNPGDLVILRDRADTPPGYDPYLWKGPAVPESIETVAGIVTGELHPGTVAIVLRVNDKEAEVVTNEGAVGWAWKAVLQGVDQ